VEALIEEVKFAVGSPLEEEGFEPSVPPDGPVSKAAAVVEQLGR
jgi:hypothetical protein